MDLALDRGRDQQVAGGRQERVGIHVRAAARVSLDAAVLVQMGAQRRDVDAAVIEDHAFARHHADDQRAVLLGQVPGQVVADVAEPLHHDPLAFQPAIQAGQRHILGTAEQLAHRELHPAPGRLGAAGDAAGGDRLAGYASQRVDLFRVQGAVDVGDPAHLARAGAHVGRRYVAAGAQVAARDELAGVAARDRLQLAIRILSRFELHAALRAAERDVHQRALVGHEPGQRLHLVLVDAGGVADAALGRQQMRAVRGAPAAEDVEHAVVEPHREVHLQHRIARLDLLRQAGRQVQVPQRPVHGQGQPLVEARLRCHGIWCCGIRYCGKGVDATHPISNVPPPAAGEKTPPGCAVASGVLARSSIGAHGEDRSRRRAASVGLTELGSPTILTLMGASATLGKTYRYRFKVDGRVVYVGITTDLQRREREHQRRWPGGVIEQVGQPTSHRVAWEWERQQAVPGSITAV